MTSLKKRRLRGDLINVNKYLMVGNEDEEARIFPVETHEILCRNTRKHFFPGRVAEHWNSLPGEVVESPSVEICKTQLATALNNLLEQGGWTK